MEEQFPDHSPKQVCLGYVHFPPRTMELQPLASGVRESRREGDSRVLLETLQRSQRRLIMAERVKFCYVNMETNPKEMLLLLHNFSSLKTLCLLLAISLSIFFLSCGVNVKQWVYIVKSLTQQKTHG